MHDKITEYHIFGGKSQEKISVGRQKHLVGKHEMMISNKHAMMF
jgi:hypothetical protein